MVADMKSGKKQQSDQGLEAARSGRLRLLLLLLYLKNIF
jgi:hypothetical protein